MPVSTLALPPGHVVTAAEATRMAEATQPYTAYTPTVTGVATSARAGRWHRHGDDVVYDWSITLSGAPTGTIQVSLPVNASAALGTFASRPYLRGVCSVLAGAAITPGFISIDGATTLRLLTTAGAYWDAGTPAGLGNTHIITGHLEYEAA